MAEDIIQRVYSAQPKQLRRKIVHVEDSITLGKLVYPLLESEGYAVIQLLNKSDLLDFLQNGEGNDLYLLDGQVPDGFDSHIARTNWPSMVLMVRHFDPSAKILVYSAQDYREGCDRMGVDYISKGSLGLLNRIGSLLNEKNE